MSVTELVSILSEKNSLVIISISSIYRVHLQTLMTVYDPNQGVREGKITYKTLFILYMHTKINTSFCETYVRAIDNILMLCQQPRPYPKKEVFITFIIICLEVFFTK